MNEVSENIRAIEYERLPSGEAQALLKNSYLKEVLDRLEKNATEIMIYTEDDYEIRECQGRVKILREIMVHLRELSRGIIKKPINGVV